MSADNWAECPKCSKDKDAGIEKAEKQLAESYGKIPSLTWKANFDKLANEKSSNLNQTLREDYEIGIYKNSFDISYGCSCDVCGFSYSYKHSIPTADLLKLKTTK